MSSESVDSGTRNRRISMSSESVDSGTRNLLIPMARFNLLIPGNVRRPLAKDDPLHRFCVACKLPYVNILFSRNKTQVLERTGFRKKEGCGCPLEKTRK